MMKDNQISQDYAKTCADSCDEIGMPWEYIEWYNGKSGKGTANAAWAQIPTPIKNRDKFTPKNESAQCATSGHAMAWCKVRDLNEPAIIFEHDSILLQEININIPDDMIVVLGYKLENPEEYNHKAAGQPVEIIKIEGHEGAHAYAITPKTAISLLKELEDKGIQGAIDNTHFLRSRKTSVPIHIMSPTPAIGWLRQSTIWKKSATKNYNFIKSFSAHYTDTNIKNKKENPKKQNIVQPEVTGDKSKITITEHNGRKPKKVISRGKAARKLRGGK